MSICTIKRVDPGVFDPCGNSVFLDDNEREFVRSEFERVRTMIQDVCWRHPVTVLLYGSGARREIALGYRADQSRYIASDFDFILIHPDDQEDLGRDLARRMTERLIALKVSRIRPGYDSRGEVDLVRQSEASAMLGHHAQTMALAFAWPVYKGIQVSKPIDTSYDDMKLLALLSQRVLSLLLAQESDTFTRNYYPITIALECCRVVLGSRAKGFCYADLYHARHDKPLEAFLPESAIANLVHARERFGRVAAPAFDLQGLVGRVLDIVIARLHGETSSEALSALVQGLSWPNHMYHIAVLLAFAGERTSFSGETSQFALDYLTIRIRQLFGIELPEDGVDVLDVLTRGSAPYLALQLGLNLGRRDRHLRNFIRAT